MQNMYFSEATVVLMLIIVPRTFGRTRSYPYEPFNCNKFLDFLIQEHECRPDDFFRIFDEDDDVLTGDQLLEEIKDECSKQSAIESYMSCMNKLDADCPEQFPVIRDALERQTSMFCAGTEVSAWLSARLQSGFTYSTECKPLSARLAGPCLMKAAPNMPGINNSTLSAAIDIMTPLLSELFQCSKTAFSETPALFKECGSSWQDMLLAIWLRLLKNIGFAIHLVNTEDVNFWGEFLLGDNEKEQ